MQKDQKDQKPWGKLNTFDLFYYQKSSYEWKILVNIFSNKQKKAAWNLNKKIIQASAQTN